MFPDRAYPPLFTITKNGRFVRFEATTGLVAEFDGFWVGLIKIPDSYAMKVDGLCGNFDGDANNDMMTSGKVLSTNYAEVGNSWQVNDPENIGYDYASSFCRIIESNQKSTCMLCEDTQRERIQI